MDCFKNFPYTEHDPRIKDYLLIVMGYNIGTFLTHCCGSRKNDFVEMGFHHLVAVYLFGGCYLFNAWEVGAVIAYLHDTADISANLVKSVAETNFKNTTVVIFLLHIVFWFYTRNLVLPWMVYEIITTGPVMGHIIIRPFFCYLLSCLCVLHYYWFNLFIQVLLHYMRSGQTEDAQNKTEVAKQE